MSPRTRSIVAAVLLVAMTLAAYWPATQCRYIWDNGMHVYSNPHLRTAAGLGDIWFQIGATPQYYPLVHTSYWLEYRLWGPDPAGYHTANIRDTLAYAAAGDFDRAARIAEHAAAKASGEEAAEIRHRLICTATIGPTC